VSDASETPPPLDAPPPAPARRKSRLRFWLLLGGGVLLAVCGGGALIVWRFVRNLEEATPEERQAIVARTLQSMAGPQTEAADAFIAAVDEKRDDDAWAATAPAFRGTTTREKFGDFAQLVRDVVGRLKSKTLVGFNTRTVLGGDAVAALSWSAKFEKGDGTIQIDVVSLDGAWKIQKWNVNSPLFVEAMKKGAGK